jgi:hypothetical protein
VAQSIPVVGGDGATTAATTICGSEKVNRPLNKDVRIIAGISFFAKVIQDS